MMKQTDILNRSIYNNQCPLLSMDYTPNAENPEVGGYVYAVKTTGAYYGTYGTPTIDGYPSRNDD